MITTTFWSLFDIYISRSCCKEDIVSIDYPKFVCGWLRFRFARHPENEIFWIRDEPSTRIVIVLPSTSTSENRHSSSRRVIGVVFIPPGRGSSPKKCAHTQPPPLSSLSLRRNDWITGIYIYIHITNIIYIYISIFGTLI